MARKDLKGEHLQSSFLAFQSICVSNDREGNGHVSDELFPKIFCFVTFPTFSFCFYNTFLF